MGSSFVNDVILGGTSGAIAKTVSAPLERVKLLLQLQEANPQIKIKYLGFCDCFKSIYKNEGVLAFWRGNYANVIRYFPTTGLNFGFKEITNKYFNLSNSQSNTSLLIKNIIIGGIAGMLSTIVIYPLDFTRTRMGVDIGSNKERRFKSLSDCMMQIIKLEGVKGIYTGLSISLFSIFVYRGLYFGIFDFGKSKINNYESLPFYKKYLFAQFVTNFSEFIGYPIDTLRRRIMMNAGNDKIYKNSFDCFMKIIKNEGITGFYKGNLSNVMRSVNSSLILVLYDELKKKANYN